MRMRKRIFLLLVPMLLWCVSLSSRDTHVHVADTNAMNAVVDKYVGLLAELVAGRGVGQGDSVGGINRHSPYYLRIFAPGTLYRAPLHQTFGVEWKPSLPARMYAAPSFERTEDMNRKIWEEENRQLMRAYVSTPWLVKTTERSLEESGAIQEEVIPELPEKPLATLPEMNIDLSADIGQERLTVRRPNFWTIKGDYSLQFTQTHFSDNWYQGGDDNYTMLALVTMDANFNNKQRIQWDNRLEMRLGFQTAKDDEVHHIKTNDDLLRFTTKIGFKATKRWFYTLQMQVYTQFYPSYKANSENVVSDFMSPLNLVLSLGMDYKLELKRFSGSAILAPVAYNFRMVSRPSLYGHFGLEKDERKYHNFGPNITVKYSWNILKNINWSSRIYWFSNLESTDIEWENTFTFTLTKYLNTKLFLYPRIDDSSRSYRNEEKGSYFMFKEWFSLGVNYKF